MTLTGALAVRLGCHGAVVNSVSIASSRPAGITRVLVGREPDGIVELVARLFSVCAHAQSAAAAEAIGAACAKAPGAPRETREIAVALERVQEDLWRLLVDWPVLMDIVPNIDALASARRSAAPLMEALAAHAREGAECHPAARADHIRSVSGSLNAIATLHVFGESPATFLERADENALRAWAARASTPAARIGCELLAREPRLGVSGVPRLALDRNAVENDVLPALDRDPGFASAPEIAGEPRETGAIERALSHPAVAALAASYGSGSCTRLFARLVQLAITLEDLSRLRATEAIEAWSPVNGDGVAVVSTARGSLVHRARVAGGTVRAYAIVAPTEWTFHARGAVARGLAGLRSHDQASLLREARVIVGLADPCVPCTVEIDDA